MTEIMKKYLDICSTMRRNDFNIFQNYENFRTFYVNSKITKIIDFSNESCLIFVLKNNPVQKNISLLFLVNITCVKIMLTWSCRL